MIPRHKKSILILLLADLLIIAALAFAVRLPFLSSQPLPQYPPHYDWTVPLGGYYYGVFGAPSYTCIMYRSDYVTLDLPLYALAAFASILPLVTTVAWLAYVSRRHENLAT